MIAPNDPLTSPPATLAQVRPLPLGVLMARSMVEFDTMKALAALPASADLRTVLSFLSSAAEFSGQYLRVAEKKALFALNCSAAVRFPLMAGNKKAKVRRRPNSSTPHPPSHIPHPPSPRR